MFTSERDERAPAKILFLEPGLGLRDAVEALVASWPDGDDQASPGGKLLDEGFGDGGGTTGDDDDVVRCLLGVAKAPVAVDDGDVVDGLRVGSSHASEVGMDLETRDVSAWLDDVC